MASFNWYTYVSYDAMFTNETHSVKITNMRTLKDFFKNVMAPEMKIVMGWGYGSNTEQQYADDLAEFETMTVDEWYVYLGHVQHVLEQKSIANRMSNNARSLWRNVIISDMASVVFGMIQFCKAKMIQHSFQNEKMLKRQKSQLKRFANYWYSAGVIPFQIQFMAHLTANKDDVSISELNDYMNIVKAFLPE